MPESKVYSARSVFEGMKKTFHQYIEAQYHIWDEGLIEERRSLLDQTGVSFQEPRIEATPFYQSGKPYRQLSIPEPAKTILALAADRANLGIYEAPYEHQAESLEAFLGRGEEIIVATGTGSGKTECFLMPILGTLAVESVERPDSWALPGVRALLLYPMNALVNDQLARLRRLLGDEHLARALKGGRDHRATFGRYTSRTPYPGEETSRRDVSRIGALLERLLEGLTPSTKALLEAEGKWPAKDIERFLETSFATGPDDSELFSRQEMQKASPDILITNYSMLEYMLLRPIERSIFQETAEWLAANKQNRFIVVLDEAHMYRGSGGAEVAYLLRRLHSRLSARREQVQYILTSASLGSGDEASRQIKAFAADLTGLESSARRFTLITGVLARKQGERAATETESAAMASYDFSTLHSAYEDVSPATEAIRKLLPTLGYQLREGANDEASLQNGVYEWLESFGPAALCANQITSKPLPLSDISRVVFPEGHASEKAMEALLALMSFARQKDTERVFAPVRSHLFFRGLPGLYACINPNCDGRVRTDRSSLLGRLFQSPRLRCSCGSRVYEVLTHRDCGAAFIRGYLSDPQSDFLWHEPSIGLLSEGALLAAHFLVDVARSSHSDTGRMEGSKSWLHIKTGQLLPSPPPPDLGADYLPILRPDGVVKDRGIGIYSFDRECPVCLRRWNPNTTKIMDLATKGEAPFAHLVREQVSLQPPTRRATEQSPNAGRKSLLFSDGRQRAARLARDIPREIEQDVFRQVLILAASALDRVGQEPVLSHWMYAGVIHVLTNTGLQLFDGEDRHALRTAVSDYRKWHECNLQTALGEFTNPPPRFTSLLLRQLGAPFYSLSALTLAYMSPTVRVLQVLSEKYPSIDKESLLALTIVWLQAFANRFAFDLNVRPGIRQQAAGYPVVTGLSADSGFSKRQQKFLVDRFGDIGPMTNAFVEALCEPDSQGFLFIAPKRVKLQVAVRSPWFQCETCTAVSPVVWWGHCPNCLSPKIASVNPEESSYLRARKGFWRDPVVRILEGKEKPVNLTVEEHTAQLSFRDIGEPDATTEDFENRFRDILIKKNATSIDVLSSTTTMEVGIDIGSLVAVGLRNIPPLRQNYQQRAGRAGRRGSAVSTVLTYAQNSPHDNHYFESPQRIISGDPTMPGVDTNNPKIIERHIRAQLIQVFFHSRGVSSGSGNIFTMLGETWRFYEDKSAFSLEAFKTWLEASVEAKECFEAMRVWLPDSYRRQVFEVANDFIAGLEFMRPRSPEELGQAEEYLIDFFFGHGFLPAYAFPRDLCALQIEGYDGDASRKRVKVIQRPQQALSIALSEYAPGRTVVVNKKTYRVGTVAAGGTSTVVDRAERLFAGKRTYVHCKSCHFTTGFLDQEVIEGRQCPLCQAEDLSAVSVIQPEVVYPEGHKEVDEYDDEQVFSQATGAQLPIPEGGALFQWKSFLAGGQIAIERNQPLVMVNKGQESPGDDDGFLVCEQCGKTSLDPTAIGPHERDYLIDLKKGAPKPSRVCAGTFRRVYLGYSFESDVLLFRIPIKRPLRFDPRKTRFLRPMSDGLRSLCEALVLAIAHTLDIDIREVSAGFRFVKYGADHVADIFIYDTLAGGAGYATQAGNVFSSVFDEVERLLRDCDCSSSCDKCLRHYGNRFFHESLDRMLALDLVTLIKEGRVPEPLTRTAQQDALGPLAAMLDLAGWLILRDGQAPVTATRNGRSVDFWCCPSLIEPEGVGIAASDATHVLTPFELSKDLPGVYAEVT